MNCIKVKLPEGFLDEEERCGYVVTQKMKKVWAVELDLLIQLMNVCKKYNIKIFACAGTMLGAVRHNGFIPWDDDIDMAMPRSDYEKLCSVAKDEFSYPYFFQTEYTENGTMRGHAQLRNSETTAIMNFERGKGSFNQGIFVDIFPVDRVIDDENLLKKQSRKVRRLKRVLKFTRQSVGLNKNAKGARGVAKKILYYLLSPLRWLKVNERVYRRFEKECARYDNEDTKQFSLLSFDFDKKRDYKFVEDYEELIEVPFEFITIPIAKNYDRALRTEYGDYMQFVRGTMTHGDVFFDPDKSYKEYI